MSARPSRTRVVWLAAALGVLCILITSNVIPAVFTLDDENYLVNVVALRHGGLTVQNTAGLTPSRELLFFDPAAGSRAVTTTPVGSTAPPLYAFLALPFSWLGWRGLVLLNTLSYLATIWIVFRYAERDATRASTPWIAAVAFAFGGWMLKYTLGLWPHALSVLLCTAGIAIASSVIDGAPARRAAITGLLIATAVGIRYQNAVMLISVGTGIMLWAPGRWKAIGAFGGAAAPLILANSVINHVRLGSWNPISKGPGYLNVAVPIGATSSVFDPLRLFWGRLVDFTVRPPLNGHQFEGWYQYDPVTGAHMMMGLVAKKAVLQSAPWAVLAIVLFVVAWAPRFRIPEHQRRHLRLFSLVSFALLSTFALSAVTRNEGLSFNERYLLELLPLAAIALAWGIDEVDLRWWAFGTGAATGLVLALAILMGTPPVGGPDVPGWAFRQIAIMRVPLALAALFAGAWIATRAGHGRGAFLSAALGCCLAWSFTVHVGTDVVGSQSLRTIRFADMRALADALPDHSALVGYWGNKDAVGPLLLTRDIVVLETEVDEGRDAPTLIRELLARHRRVFVLEDGFSAAVLDRVLAGLRVTPTGERHLRIVEAVAE